MTEMRPLTERQEKVLVIMLNGDRAGMTPNDIGYQLGLLPVRRTKGPWSGIMGPAQRVIGTIRGLVQRELVCHGRRSDGLSGTAYKLTEHGHRRAVELEERS